MTELPPSPAVAASKTKVAIRATVVMARLIAAKADGGLDGTKFGHWILVGVSTA